MLSNLYVVVNDSIIPFEYLVIVFTTELWDIFIIQYENFSIIYNIQMLMQMASIRRIQHNMYAFLKLL